MDKGFLRALALAGLGAALCCLTLLTGCKIKTYNMLDPGRPSQTVSDFYRAVSDGDDEAANQLLANYEWRSCFPEKTADGGYSVNSRILDGSDAVLFNCLMESRECLVVSESDYTKDDTEAYVTVRYTSFDIKKFEKELAERSVKTVRKKQYNGKVFKDADDTRDIIEKIKLELLRNPSAFYTTRDFRITLISVDGKWKIKLTEDFFKALSGYSD